MPLGDTHALMAKQNRDAFNWHASQEQLDGECIAQPMRHCIAQTLGDAGEVENLLYSSLPITDDRLPLSMATPEVPRICSAWCCLKNTENGLGHHRIDRDAGLLGVEKEAIAVVSVGCQRHRIGYSH